jgi:16S rRNA (guanine1207-N2)-methyltransferase
LLRAHKLAAAPADPAVSTPRWRDPDAWHELATTVDGESLTLVSRPGMFSWEHLDEATALLADVMPVRAGDRVLDLGCGTGALGLVAARRVGPEGHVVCLDADADAVRAAIHAAARNGISNLTAYASDAGEVAAPGAFDAVLTNPPFHVGKGTELSVPRAFIDDAWTALRPGGQLALVANRTLPYERLIADRFGAVHTLHDGRRFKVLGATRA